MILTPQKVQTEWPVNEEVWLDIPGFEGFYQISTFGQIKSLDRTTDDDVKPRRVKERIMKISYTRDTPYCTGSVTLRAKEVTRSVSVNALMFETFIKVMPDGFNCLTHIDRNRENYRLDNLAFSRLGNWR